MEYDIRVSTKGNRMKNLAGVETCDELILEELLEAGIQCMKIQRKDGERIPEVPYTIIGILGGHEQFNADDCQDLNKTGWWESHLIQSVSFTFTRAWYYWVVTGYVPLSVAEELYEDSVGAKAVRSGGDCACRPPKTWLTRHPIVGMKVVNLYHIDSQEGLNLFTKTLRKHNLV